MRTLLCVTILATAQTLSAQWVKQAVDTMASLRGLSVVNEKVVWASGTGGTVIRTIDGGKTWKVMTVPGAEKLDFRDIEAFDANTAYSLSIGNGELSRIYKTTDGGATWKEQFRNKNEKAFFDAVACWDKNNCIAMSDPVDGKFLLMYTKDGGSSWSTYPNPSDLPSAKDGEAAFAASGTCLILYGRSPLLATGGMHARVFRFVSLDGFMWLPSETPIVRGTAGSGIFSIAMLDKMNGVIVGGNYEKPDDAKDNLAFTTDGGRTWKLGTGLTGYRSGVAYVDKRRIIAVGTNGSDMSTDGGKTWKKVGLIPFSDSKVPTNVSLAALPQANLNAVQAKGSRGIWAVGPTGMVVKFADLEGPN